MKREPSTCRHPLLAVVAGIALAGLVLVVVLVQLRAERLRLAREEVQATALAQEALVSRSLLAVKLALGQVVQVLQTGFEADTLDESWLRRQLSVDAELLQYVWTITVLDREGRVRLANLEEAAGLDLSGRAFFVHHQHSRDEEIHVSGPMRSRLNHQWIFVASRGVYGADGTLRFVAAAALDPQRFVALWRSLNVGGHGAIALYMTDGTLLMRTPWRDDDPGLVDRDRLPHILASTEADGHTYTGRSAVDGVERIVHLRPVAGHPTLVVSVGRATDEVLHEWTQMATFLLATWFVAGVLLVAVVRSRLRTQRKLVAYAQLASDAPLPVWRLSRDGDVIEANPAAARLDADGHPHWQAVRRRAASVRASTAWLERIDDRWLDVHAQPAVVGTGVHLYAVDVTEARDAQERLGRQLERADLLQRITRAITARMEIRRVYVALCLLVERRLPADACWVMTCDGPRSGLRLQHAGGRARRRLGALAALACPDPGQASPIDALLGPALQLRAPLRLDLRRPPADRPLPRELTSAGLRHLVVAPLLAHERLAGLLVVARAADRGFADDELAFVGRLAEQVVVAMQQAQMHQGLRDAVQALRESRVVQEDAERLRHAAQIASGVAHDINNALGPVALYLDSLLQPGRGLDAHTVARLRSIQVAVDDVTRTVDRMRSTYVHASSEQSSVVDLAALVDDVLGEVPACVSVHVDIEPGMEQPCLMAETLKAALRPLVRNACEAMPRGGELRLSVTRERGPERRLCLEVSDTGPGLDDAARRRAMEPYFTTKPGRGSGLGLPIAADAARRLGGRLTLLAARPTGLCARLLVPAAANRPAPAGAPEPMR